MSREPKLCGDCGAEPGAMHAPGCDVERCRLCGGQAISCACNYPLTEDGDTRDATDEESDALEARIEEAGGRLPWTGIWPGVMECYEFGWYCRMVEGRWVKCDKDAPGADADLNRLHEGNATWDVKAGRWVAKKGDDPVTEAHPMVRAARDCRTELKAVRAANAVLEKAIASNSLKVIGEALAQQREAFTNLANAAEALVAVVLEGQE